MSGARRASPLCVDRTLQDGSSFVDSGGDDCADYADNHWCSSAGGEYPNQGVVANAACCACGGGDWNESQAAQVKAVLMVLYHATSGKGWKKQDGWDSARSYCKWVGVYCAASGQVQTL